MNLTKLEKFSETAMQSLLSNSVALKSIFDNKKYIGFSHSEALAKESIIYAKALLKQLENETTTQWQNTNT